MTIAEQMRGFFAALRMTTGCDYGVRPKATTEILTLRVRMTSLGGEVPKIAWAV